MSKHRYFFKFKKLYDFFVRYTAIVFTVEQHTWNKKAKKMINSREKIMKIIETPQGCYGTFIREAISIKICLCILVIISSSFKAWNQNSTVNRAGQHDLLHWTVQCYNVRHPSQPRQTDIDEISLHLRTNNVAGLYFSLACLETKRDLWPGRD